MFSCERILRIQFFRSIKLVFSQWSSLLLIGVATAESDNEKGFYYAWFFEEL